MNKLSNPHDSLFQKALADKRVAEDFFRQWLPSNIQSLMDWEALAPCQTTFLDEELRRSAGDVLYQTSFQGQSGYLYILAEHQSTVDSLMAFRLLKYTVRIMEYHLDQNNSSAELPIVYPLVFYHGQEPYTGATDIFELFGPHQALARETLFKPFQLVDVTKISDQELKQHLWSGTLAFIFKHIFVSDLLTILQGLRVQLVTLKGAEGTQYIGILLKYLSKRAKIRDTKQAYAFLKEAFTDTSMEADMTTLADYLKEEGFKEGLSRGLSQGIEKEKKYMAIKLLQEGMDILMVAKLTELPIEKIQSLEETTVL